MSLDQVCAESLLSEAPSDPALRRPARIHPSQAARGQALVEFAFLISLLLLMAFGVFEFGRGFLTKLVIVHAARDGARVAVDPAKTDAEIIATVHAAATPLAPADVSVLVTRPGDETHVRIRYDFTSAVPLIHALWGGGAMTLEHTAVSWSG